MFFTIECSDMARLFFTFDTKKGRLVPCHVIQMKTGGSYYVVEPSKQNKLVFGTFRQIEPEDYDRSFPTCPKVTGDFPYLRLFITHSGYDSLTEVNSNRTLSHKILSLSTSTDDYGAGYYDEQSITPRDYEAITPSSPLSPDYVNKYLQQGGPNEHNLASMFKDIQRAREDREISQLLDRYHNCARYSTDQLGRWKKFKALTESYDKTGDEKTRNELLCCVAINQGANPKQVFIDSLLAYKKERTLIRQGEYSSEYYTVWAALFSSSAARSKTAKLAAVDTIISDLYTGNFSFDKLPEAANNGRLKELISNFKKAQEFEEFDLEKSLSYGTD